MLTRAFPDKTALEKLPVTISMTLTVKEWGEVRSQLDANKWPACDVARAIRDAVTKLETALEVYDYGAES